MKRIGDEKSAILHTMSRVSGRCLANNRRTRDAAVARRARAFRIPLVLATKQQACNYNN